MAIAIISEGKTGGAHDVEGIGIGFDPPLLDQSMFNEARTIDEDEAREIVRGLAKEEGLFTGTSSELNVAATLTIAQGLGPGFTVVAIAMDTR